MRAVLLSPRYTFGGRFVEKLLEKAPVSQQELETLVNDAPKFLENFEVGDVSHQGDLILVRIARLPKSAKPRQSRQLATGSTIGSRHILERGDVYECNPQEVVDLIASASGCRIEAEYTGLAFVSPEDPTENDVTHPQHGNQGFPAGAVIAVVYQRSWDQEQRKARRVAD